MINVTKTYLPDFDKYISVLKRSWDKAWITNNGELVQELEVKLKEYLGVKNLLFASNGTIVLQMALKALNITKEVITTPFSYVATTNAILWEGCTPIFVDIEPGNYCIDPKKIEDAITDKTQAILATHVYGFPCNVERINEIAIKHGLKVIYDGAHAFSSEYNGHSLLNYGDISTCSFHATKLYHTVEGGCIICNDDETFQKLSLFRSFGHIYDSYFSVGINAKNSEFHAAMGLCVLEDINKIVISRKSLCENYDALLTANNYVTPCGLSEDRCSYYPVLFQSEKDLLAAINRLNEIDIYPRRYFYPSLNTLKFTGNFTCPISEDISKRILCLPLYFGLENETQKIIIEIILKGKL
jgi:dTDP-4-amino-4,6-dideoxygalactose transaminase